MKIRNIVYGVLLSFMIFSCKHEQENTEYTLIDSSTPIQTKDIKLSSIISIKNIIPLETTENSLIGDWGKILKFGNRIYVSFNRTTLVIFDEQGRYVDKIHKIGNGPGEYKMIGDFDVTKDGIYIRAYKRVLQYAHDGTFLRDIPFDLNLFGIKVIEDHILGFVTLNEYVSHIFNMDGKCINKFYPSSQTAGIGQPFYYRPYGDDRYFLSFPTTGDLVMYDAKNNKYSTGKLIDLPDLLTVDKLNLLYKEKGNRVNKKEYARIIRALDSNSTHLFLLTQRDDSQDALWIKDLKDNSCRAFSCKHIINDVTSMPVDCFFTSFAKAQDSFLTFISPGELREALNDTKMVASPYYERMKEIADNLTEEDNFIIIEYEFK